MIVDSSAVIAILLREPGYEALVEKLAASPASGIGAPTLAEAAIVMTSRTRRDAAPMVALFAREAGLAVVPFGDAHWRAAVAAYLRFGKGRHRAALNFGDCMSYATAKLADQPLLCVGQDFGRTDLRLA